MQTFGKTMRNCLPALGLGLMGAFGLASVTAVTAPAAVAQAKAKKEFVENYNAATTAMKSGKYTEAVDKANAAMPHATDTAQKAALLQVIASSYCTAKKHAECVSAIDKAKANGGLQASVVQNFDKILAGEYAALGQAAKALDQTKKNIDKYGGDATEFAYVARGSLIAKNYADALAYAQKAIDKSSKPSDKHYNIMLNAYVAQGKMDQYYKILERVAPIFKKEDYWKPLIERAKKEPKFKSDAALLDVYRALDAAGVKLTTKDQQEMGDMALNRGLAIEAEKIWAPLFKSGTLGGAGDQNAERNKKLFARAQADAKADKATELAASEAAAASKPSGEAFASTGEAYLGAGDYAKAVDLMQKGLAKGQMDAGVADLIRLRLGIAQFKGGKKEDARKTWADIKSDNGSAWLAKVWTAISKA